MRVQTVLWRAFLTIAWICIAGLLTALLLLAYAYASVMTHFDGSGGLPADCAIVFGAAVYGIDTPSPALIRRTAAAAEYYRTGNVDRLILSGGKGRGSSKDTEAQVMKVLALEQGVDEKDIMLEPAAHSTYENLLLGRNLADDCTSVVGISDQYHLARIELLARRIGWDDLTTVPAQDRPPVGSERRSVVREVFAYIYYMLRADLFIEL